MALAPSRGTALRVQRLKIRFEKSARRGRPCGSFDVAEVRKLLRTDMTLAQIAVHLGTTKQILRNFIKRRNLCNVQDRARFISLQESIAKIGEVA